MGDRRGHPLRLQLLLDGAFIALALATFAQVWDPDILFHGIWVVLTLEAFLFGLRVSAVRIALALVLLVAYFALGASTGPSDDITTEIPRSSSSSSMLKIWKRAAPATNPM